MAKKMATCSKCRALCCRYVALPIDKPTDRGDFDDIRWYLNHEGVSVFVEKGEWYVNFSGPCRHIDKNHRCAIYEKRPRICRKYKTNNCDLSSDEYNYELHFTDDRQMEEYIKVKFDNMKVRASVAGKKAARNKTKAKK